MNQASYTLLHEQVSAVPVLPATTTPGICACVPVPACTTSTIMFFSSPAVDGFVAVPQHVRVEPLDRPSRPARRTCLISVGRISTPPFATAAATIAICSGVVSILSWPNASRPGSTRE